MTSTLDRLSASGIPRTIGGLAVVLCLISSVPWMVAVGVAFDISNSQIAPFALIVFLLMLFTPRSIELGHSRLHRPTTRRSVLVGYAVFIAGGFLAVVMSEPAQSPLPACIIGACPTVSAVVYCLSAGRNTPTAPT
jgi:TctA family transporter